MQQLVSALTNALVEAVAVLLPAVAMLSTATAPDLLWQGSLLVALAQHDRSKKQSVFQSSRRQLIGTAGMCLLLLRNTKPKQPNWF